MMASGHSAKLVVSQASILLGGEYTAYCGAALDVISQASGTRDKMPSIPVDGKLEMMLVALRYLRTDEGLAA